MAGFAPDHQARRRDQSRLIHKVPIVYTAQLEKKRPFSLSIIPFALKKQRILHLSGRVFNSEFILLSFA
ncbi:hypothetical protein F2P81_002263 [Scophthalmus maximus]|uniref:Uncharacterized protein n=1 Tax=Scophthalmus maximus TaxID=52904 RepID=A0A6A4TR80_SCOMX|nr:hypothetical protein F2P81_002263 [Scophthalmus maximus]